MTNLFSKLSRGVINSPFIIPVFASFVALFVISLVLGYEDYVTSLMGYEMLPTRKSTAAIVWAVAALPQIGQIAFGYYFGATKYYIAAFVFAILFAIDVGTDMYFKASGGAWYVWVIAFVESVGLFTIGSEFSFVISIGMMIELWPAFNEQLSEAASRIATVFGKRGGEDEDDTLRPQAQRPRMP